MRDQELNNVINSNSASAIYSHHIKLGYESFMTLGLQGGFTLKQFNLSNLIFPSGIDQLSGEISEYILAGYSGRPKRKNSHQSNFSCRSQVAQITLRIAIPHFYPFSKFFIPAARQF
jgi:hypothetical protein